MTNYKLNDRVLAVLQNAYLVPFKIQSDFAREFAQEVACLASLGFISTQEAPQHFGRKWRVTGIGLDQLRMIGVI